MKLSKIFLVLSLLLNIILIVFGGSQIIDQGITITYQSASIDYFIDNVKFTQYLLNQILVGKEVAEIESILKLIQDADYIVKRYDNSIEIENWVLEIKDNKIISIEDINN
tara:strand:+ start:834 stop:1163 length:330 start_codon:yes stop_codon:yes gene_type:complete